MPPRDAPRQAWAPKLLGGGADDHERTLYSPAEVAPPPNLAPRGESRGKCSGVAAPGLELEPPDASKGEGRPSALTDAAAAVEAAVALDARAGSTAKTRLRLVLRRYERSWAQLSGEQREAARELGWAAGGWDTCDLRPCLDKKWRYLNQRQREAAEALGFCGRTWELAAGEAELRARRPPRDGPRDRLRPGAKLVPTPVSTWALGVQGAATLSELYAAAGRVVGYRNMPNTRPQEILRVLRPLLAAHSHDTHELRTAFRAYDRHGDGVVSPTELRTALFDLGIELSTQQILDLISTVGGSKDDTTVDYVQFARLLAPRRDADLRQTLKEVRSTLAQLNIGIERSLKGLMHGDGIISRRELRSGLLSLHAGLTLRQVDDLVDAADSRHDGRIDIHAFVLKFRGTHSVVRGVAQLQRELQDLFHRSGVNLREAFSAFDRDGDGVISRHEFIEGLRQLNVGLSATQIEDVLAHADKDGDGRIEYSEFVRQFGAATDNRQLLQQVTDEVRALLRRKSSLGGWDVVIAGFDPGSHEQLSKHAFQQGWFRAGLSLTDRQTEAAFLSLRPNRDGLVTVNALTERYGQVGATPKQLVRLATKLCELVRSSEQANFRHAFGLTSASEKPRRASYRIHEVRSILRSLHIESVEVLNMVVDILDPEGNARITSHSLTAFLEALGVFGVAREILTQLRENIRAAFDGRTQLADSRHHGWVSTAELSKMLGTAVNCQIRPQTIARLVGQMTDRSGRVNVRELLQEFSAPPFMPDCDSSVGENSELATLAREIRRRCMHCLNAQLFRYGTSGSGGGLRLDSQQIEQACSAALRISVASSRIKAFCELAKQRNSIDAFALAPSLVAPDCDMARSARLLEDELVTLVDATQVDMWCLFDAIDRKQRDFVSLRGFTSAVQELGVTMTELEIQDAWSMISKGAVSLTRQMFLGSFGEHDLERKVSRYFQQFLSEQHLSSHDIFALIDRDGAGHVPPDELRAALQAFHTTLSLKQVDVLSALDRVPLDATGQVTFAAFAKSFGSLRSTAANVRRSFRKQHGTELSVGVLQLYDRENKGWMDEGDVAALFDEIRLELSAVQRTEFIWAVDRNNDGRLHFGSFLSVVLSHAVSVRSSGGAVREFRKEIAPVLQRGTRNVFDLLVGGEQHNVGISREAFFDGIRELRLALDPEVVSTVFALAAPISTPAAETATNSVQANLSLSFEAFVTLCGHAVPPEERATSKHAPGQVPAISAPESSSTQPKRKAKSKQAELMSYLTELLRGCNLDRAWSSFDRDADGCISAAEFKSGLRALQVDVPQDRAKQIIRLLDTGNNGRVDVDEFVRRYSDRSSEETVRVLAHVDAVLRRNGLDLEELFGSLDRNGDGCVLLSELRSAVEVHLGKQQTADLAHIFDRTGKAQLLNRADFNKIMRLQTAPLQHRSPSADQSSHAIKDEVRAILRRHGVDLRDAFSAFDRDGDGVISRHEFIEGLRSLELGLSATQMEDVLTLVDKDGDGRIEYSEFVRQFGAPRLENRRSGHDLGTALLRQTDGDLVLEDRAAIEHIMSQLAQETGCFDELRDRFRELLAEFDPSELCELLDSESRGFLCRRDFTSGREGHRLASRFGISSAELGGLGFALDFGTDDRLSYQAFCAQVEFGSHEYGPPVPGQSSRRRTGPEFDVMPGPELAVTLGELRKAFEQHCVSAAQIALELGVPPTDDDLYISWRDVVEAVRGMGLVLDDEQINSMARIRGSSGGREGGVSLRSFQLAFPLDGEKEFKASNSEVLEIHDLMQLHQLDMARDIFQGRDSMAARDFRRQLLQRLGPELLCKRAANALTLELAQDETDSEAPMRQGQVRFQAALRRFAEVSGQGASVAHPLSAELLERAATVAAASDGVLSLPHQDVNDETLQRWLMPKRTRRGLSAAGQLLEIDLADNRIGCSGAKAVACALDAGDRSLQRLSLARNRIGDDGAEALALMLQAHATLAFVDLSDNCIGKAGVRALRRASKANPRTTCLLVLSANCAVPPRSPSRKEDSGTQRRGQLKGSATKNLAGQNKTAKAKVEQEKENIGRKTSKGKTSKGKTSKRPTGARATLISAVRLGRKAKLSP